MCRSPSQQVVATLIDLLVLPMKDKPVVSIDGCNFDARIH